MCVARRRIFIPGNWGGVAPNAAWLLVHLLGTIMNAENEVLVEGFYDDVAELSPRARQAIDSLPLDVEANLASIGVEALPPPVGVGYYDRLTARPTMTINGLTSGYQGPGSKTVIPSVASAKLDMRLVPNQRATISSPRWRRMFAVMHRVRWSFARVRWNHRRHRSIIRWPNRCGGPSKRDSESAPSMFPCSAAVFPTTCGRKSSAHHHLSSPMLSPTNATTLRTSALPSSDSTPAPGRWRRCSRISLKNTGRRMPQSALTSCRGIELETPGTEVTRKTWTKSVETD